ncbi:D-amino-acid transaminase [Sporosarcina sp. PTS2304]|uniref:D-amino-acid transaminase n=1 Tax=Sporosarcina sp. PTS2304 TaxID=2283194 RepID=UPI000E0D92CF|nr:D-amino-acid transaminase [Sporosarcina sp. PTS2304]AXH99499.1 D-amino-acid transaminase [Sporosarcina sp. PTS2304]
MIYFKNGEYLDEQQMNVSVNDRGYVFGDGVYEVIKVYDGALYTVEEHLERLLESAEKIRIPLSYTIEQLKDLSKQLVEANQLTIGHVYLQVTRGVAPRAHQFPGSDVEPVVIGYAVNNPRPIEQFEMGAAMKSVDDMRWLRCDIKSLNLLGNVLAKQEAFESDCQEALFVRDGVVREGSSSNAFGIKEGVLYTHPANNFILNGITRRVVLQLARDLDIPVVEQAFTLEEALVMDEFFFTSTNSEITPVITLDGKQIGNGVPGLLTRKLQSAFSRQLPMPIAVGHAEERVSNGSAS